MASTDHDSSQPRSPVDAETTRRTATAERWMFFQKTIIAVAVVLGAAAVILLGQVLCVLFAGALLAVVLYRSARFIGDWMGLPHTISLVLLLGAVALFTWGLGLTIGPRLVGQTSQLGEKLTEAVEGLLEKADAFGVKRLIQGEAGELGKAMLSNLDTARLVGGVFSSATAFIASSLLILFIGIYAAYAPMLYYEGTVAFVSPARREAARRTLDACLDTLWWYTIGRLASMAFIGLIVTVSLWALGVALPLALGLVAGLLSFVPMIGGFVAILPALLLALQVGPLTALYVLIIYTAAQGLDNHIVTPLVQAKSVLLPPILVLISQVVIGLLFGVIGIVIATPLVAVLAELTRRLYIEPLEAGGRPDLVESS